MIPGMNPRDMQKVMKRMGIKQVELDASEVIIKMSDKDLVISNPQVSKVNMMGQETYQVVGEAQEVSKDVTPDINEDDVKTVMDQANCSNEEAAKILEENNGNIAEAILKIQGKE